MLPLLAIGAALFTAGKVSENMEKAKEWSNKAQEIANEGNGYLKEAEEYREKIKYEMETALEKLNRIKTEGINCLLNNYKYFQSFDLGKYKETIENDIKKYNLSNISINEIITLNKNINTLTTSLGIDLKHYKPKDEDLVTDADDETSAHLMAHGIMSVGIGGMAALAGMEFLAATGVGAILVAPIAIFSSGDQVDKAEKSYYEAEQFKEKAFIEKEKWKSKLEYIQIFTLEVMFFYTCLIDETIKINKQLLKNFKNNPKNLPIIIKNIIMLAYLDKFLIKYPSINEKNIGSLDEIINWIANEARNEIKKFDEISNEIYKIQSK